MENSENHLTHLHGLGIHGLLNVVPLLGLLRTLRMQLKVEQDRLAKPGGRLHV